ncbi:hypothetical protein CVH10_24205, partial [Halomonas sp. ND22Bw]|uniref:hypothetical protein n=1 Tax=Halomonas sp. ND22Bw TaxID=2054178 RepID=UPI000D2A769E
IAGVLGNTMLMVEKVYAKHSPEGLADAVENISGGALEGLSQRSIGAPHGGAAPIVGAVRSLQVSDDPTSPALQWPK